MLITTLNNALLDVSFVFTFNFILYALFRSCLRFETKIRSETVKKSLTTFLAETGRVVKTKTGAKIPVSPEFRFLTFAFNC